jgi:hypothetical protein
MLENKKGQVWGYSIMLAMVVIILGLALAPAGKAVIDDAQNASTSDFIGLDCNNDSINNFQKGACVVTDFSMFYFFGGIILIGIALIGARISIGGSG